MSNRGTSGRLASWFAALASALALPLLALALAVLALEPASALAATPPQVTLVDGEGGRTGEPVTKGGVSYTAWMSTPGMGGSAYCVNPGMDSPVGSSAATLACSPLRTENGAFGADDLAAFLWFSVDGPGYDSSMWPATDWEGNHLNDNQRYWLGHSIATYLYNGNVAAPQDSYASYINSWDKFRSWYPRIYRNVNAYEVSRINSLRDWMWAWVIDANNPNTTVAKMLARKNEVPDSFQTYTIPSSNGSQNVVGFLYMPNEGEIEILKESAEPEVTDGNPSYSFEGAIYTVRHNDASLSSLDAYIYVDASGRGTLRRWHNGTSPQTTDERIKIPGGSYVVWEHRAPKGYALDETHYEVTCKAGDPPAVITIVEPLANGTCSLVKSSSKPDLSDGNPCYSLEGAVYGVYSDSACEDLVGELTTAADGTTNELSLPSGTYHIKETQPSPGYLLDTETHKAVVETGRKTTVSATEVPGSDPRLLKLQKLDSATGKASPQGAGTLGGAEFTIEHYPGYYDSADDLPSSPANTWVVRTNDNGLAALSEEYLVSGDDIILNPKGDPTIPLGTVAIRETKPPVGYLLPDDTLVDLEQIAVGPGGSAVVTSLNAADPENLSVAEEAKSGGLKVKKVNLNGTPLKGATFSITNDSEWPVVVGGTPYAKGEVCMTITSGADGIASTGGHDLPFGTYTVTEKEAPRGYEPDGEWSAKAPISADGEIVDLTGEPCVNHRVRIEVPLEATKTLDGESQGRNLDEGMFAFTLSDEDGKVLQTKTNDANGAVTFDAITFDFWSLGDHTYTIAETRGTDEEIVYDEHVETVTVTVKASDDHTLAYEVATDGDGVAFHNETVPALEMPVTGRAGIRGAMLGTAAALASAALTMLRRRRT